MSDPRVGVGAVALNDGRIVLIQRGNEPAKGKWSLPGGHVEFGEDLHGAVLREFAEETGLEAVVDRFLGYVERIGDPPDPYHYVILDFVVDVFEATDPTPGDDAQDARWFDLDHLGDVDLADGLYEFLVDTGIIPDARAFSI